MALPLRSWAERLTRSWVLKRRLPAPFGTPLYVTPSARLGYLFKSMASVDPALLDCAAAIVRPGDTVWDIGANVGFFATAAAVKAGPGGRVVAFEPDVWMVQLLRRTVDIQPPTSAPITVVPVAVAESVAIREFVIAKRARAANALAGYGGSEMGGVAQRQSVATFNLDWLVDRFPPPDVVKIDVEGAELETLTGQSRVIEQVRPVFICEVSRQNGPAVSALLSAAGYRLYDGDRPLRAAKPVAAATWNTVAIPEEKAGLLASSAAP